MTHEQRRDTLSIVSKLASEHRWEATVSKVQDALNEVGEDASFIAELLLAEGSAYANLRDDSEALGKFYAAQQLFLHTKSTPDLLNASIFGLAGAAVNTGHNNLAIAVTKGIAENDPYWEGIHVLRGTAFLRLRMFSKAIELLDPIVKRRLGSSEIRYHSLYALSLAYFGMENNEKARDIASLLLDEFPERQDSQAIARMVDERLAQQHRQGTGNYRTTLQG